MIGNESMTRRGHIPGVLKLVGAILVLRWVFGMRSHDGSTGRIHAHRFFRGRGGIACFGGKPGSLASQGGPTGETV